MKCFNCGSIFDPADVSHYREDYGQVFSACPICGSSDIGDTECCSECGREFEPEELRAGLCLDCMWEKIDYDLAYRYMVETDGLAEFLFQDWFGTGKVTINQPSDEFKQFLSETFKRLVADEKLLGRDDFLVKCKTFCLPRYPTEWLWTGEEFAEWYEEQRREAGD